MEYTYKINMKKVRKEGRELDKAFKILKKNKISSVRLKSGEEVKI
jgi:hypothetical protein